ncbi:MAG: DUF1552 domain-containing protein [Verrucomicrobiota bacterium]
MKNSPLISRRTLLKGLGASLALPFLETMRPLRGLAAEAPLPIRMAILYMANGVRPDAWTPSATGSHFELSPILSPLAPFKDDLLVLSELWNAASDTGDGHYVKTGGFLTSTTITRTTGANLSSNGISMDQVCARRIGNLTALPSLELGIEPPATGVDANVGYTQLYGAHISWNTPTTPLSKEINPKLAFDRLFRPKMVPGDRAAAATRDRSVLDLVSEEAKSLQRKLSAADREKLSEYLESVRSVERRIEWDASRQKSTVLSDPLALREIEGLGKRVDAYSDPARVSERRGDPGEHVDLMLDLVALAFWTDATRIATFMFGNAVSSRSFAFLGDGIGGHHQTSHHENHADKLAQYQRINTWHLEKYAYLLGKLKSIREGDGTLLDRSMILFGAGMRDGNAHNPHNLPILLAGRAGGTLATGRHLSYAKNTPLSALYRSMLTRMGTPVDHFADSRGELPGLDDKTFSGVSA